MIFAVETDDLGDFFCGGQGTVYCCSFGVDRDNLMCGVCGDGVIIAVESTTELCKDECYVAIEINTDGSDDLEGGVLSSVDNGCQGGER